MSAVAMALIGGFVCCAALIRALGCLGDGRTGSSWDAEVATDPVQVSADRPRRAMIDE
ncbi:hypothetical protein AB0C34_03200 [Nocardia sp. NPDC049220]|uniref:hypothetical protein n=1 Tax=Nocardia sp. NPDC049220 TaxID=3155273 RepID=UPI00340C5A99